MFITGVKLLNIGGRMTEYIQGSVDGPQLAYQDDVVVPGRSLTSS